MFAPSDLADRWIRSVGCAAAVALAYFLAAQLSLGLLLEPDGVAVFWPAAGISSGVLIALGPRARWPVAAGTIIATVAANLMGDRNLWAASAFAVCNAAEALITAGLIQHYFGTDFRVDRLRHVLALLAAAVAGTALSGIGAAVAYRLFHSPMAPMFITWRHWFASDTVGIVSVAPVVIGLAAAIRAPPPRSELVEGAIALSLLAVVTGVIIWLPEQPWQTVLPSALLLPTLLWLAARCQPAFAAAGAFMVSLAVVWTTVYGVGHFGDPTLRIDDRILQAQAIIFVVAIGAFVLAALFAERRDSEAKLARSNMLLQRERDNKLMNLQAVGAAIAHEMKQPLTAIAANGSAALALLKKAPPDLGEARASLSDIVEDSHRASQALDGIRALFRSVDHGRQTIDINEIAIDVLESLRVDFRQHGVAAVPELMTEIPLVVGNRSQLRQVMLNLIHNAIDAMNHIPDRGHTLQIRTQRHGTDSVAVAVKDSGPGIDPKKLESVFDAFVTTKPDGMGLGLAISRMIIERHGGQLVAASDGRNGALFQFVLPIATKEIDNADVE
jgi:signal transduction histidine kinase